MKPIIRPAHTNLQKMLPQSVVSGKQSIKVGSDTFVRFGQASEAISRDEVNFLCRMFNDQTGFDVLDWVEMYKLPGHQQNGNLVDRPVSKQKLGDIIYGSSLNIEQLDAVLADFVDAGYVAIEDEGFMQDGQPIVRGQGVSLTPQGEAALALVEANEEPFKEAIQGIKNFHSVIGPKLASVSQKLASVDEGTDDVAQALYKIAMLSNVTIGEFLELAEPWRMGEDEAESVRNELEDERQGLNSFFQFEYSRHVEAVKLLVECEADFNEILSEIRGELGRRTESVYQSLQS